MFKNEIIVHEDVDMVAHFLMDKSTQSSGLYVHGVNCQGVMRSGIAKVFRSSIPRVYEEYEKYIKDHFVEERKFCQENNLIFNPDTARRRLLGHANIININATKGIVNAFTQFDYGRNPEIVYCNYDAVRVTFRTINQHPLSSHGVHFPLIGCGLANGNWAIVKRIILEEIDISKPLHLYLYEQKTRKMSHY